MINPWIIKIGCLAVFVIGLFYLKNQYIEEGKDLGRTEVTNQRNKQDDVNNKAAGEEQARRTLEAGKKEESLKALITFTEAKAQKENKDHETALQKANARALAGNSGMQCPSSKTTGKTAGQPAREDSSSAGVGVDDGGTSLLPSAAITIQSVASDSARLVRDKNKLILLYNAAMATCNAP